MQHGLLQAHTRPGPTAAASGPPTSAALNAVEQRVSSSFRKTPMPCFSASPYVAPGSISSSNAAPAAAPGPRCATSRFSMGIFLALMKSNRLVHSLRWMLLRHKRHARGRACGRGHRLLRVRAAPLGSCGARGL